MSYELIAQYSQVASSVLFLAVMVWIWNRFIQPAVLKAQENANAQIAQAERHRDQAKAALDALQGEIEAASRDADAIKQRCVVQARSEHDALIREAREAGERAVRNAQGELQRARQAARGRLRDELLEKALDTARVQAASRVDDPTNARLLQAFIASLGTRVSTGDGAGAHGQ
jgi:F0F1-type ATP synthase membrane subunit b/b'